MPFENRKGIGQALFVHVKCERHAITVTVEVVLSVFAHVARGRVTVFAIVSAALHLSDHVVGNAPGRGPGFHFIHFHTFIIARFGLLVKGVNRTSWYG